MRPNKNGRIQNECTLKRSSFRQSGAAGPGRVRPDHRSSQSGQRRVLAGRGVNVVLPLAIAYGGTIQIIAGLLEYRTGNTFA